VIAPTALNRADQARNSSEAACRPVADIRRRLPVTTELSDRSHRPSSTPRGGNTTTLADVAELNGILDSMQIESLASPSATP
jgi:hypothetical protein